MDRDGKEKQGKKKSSNVTKSEIARKMEQDGHTIERREGERVS